MPEAPTQNASGDHIGPYLLVRPLGHGGMGQVWLAHDARLHRKVALKRLHTEGEDASARERILREARAAARITHPNVATIHDVLDADGRTYIVMEYVEGESLSQRLARLGRIPSAEVVEIGRQLASGLAEAHAQGVIHRDLKPANVQMTPGGVAKILDFGVARTLAQPASTTAETMAPLRANAQMTDGVRAGTQAYMSPEQLLGRHVDHRSDIYSLGVLLFELAVGRPPFPMRDLLEHIVDVTSKPAPAAHHVDSSVARPLSDVIATCLAREPDERYQSADALRDALCPAAPRATRAMATGAVAAVLTIAVAAAIVTVWQPLGHPVRPATIAVLSVEAGTSVPIADALAREVESLVVSNLRTVAGVTVVSRAALAGTPRDEVDRMRQALHVDYAIDLTLTAAEPRLQLSGRIRDLARASASWSGVIAADRPLAAEHQLLDAIDGAFRDAGVWRNGLPSAADARLRRLRTSSDEAFGQYIRGQAVVDAGGPPASFDQAISFLQAAVRADASFGLAWAALADALSVRYERTKDADVLKQANVAAATAIRTAPDASAPFRSLGRLQNIAGRRDDAITSFRRALQVDADDDGAARQLATALASRGDVDAAIEAGRAAIAIRPRAWPNHYALGFIYYNAGRYAEAIAELRRVTELEPEGARGYLLLGAAFHKRGDLQQAIGNYEHAVRLSPNASAFSNLALIYYQSERYQDAVRAFQSAVGADPAQPVLQRNLGDALMKAQRTADARAAYSACVDLGNRQLGGNNRDAAAIALVALCEAKLGRRDEAERHGAESLALAPADREVVYKNAAIAAVLNDRDRSLRYLNDALRLGYQPQLAREDDDFAGLRSLPEFKRLTASKPE
jgi:serine/threonine-protein kinase